MGGSQRFYRFNGTGAAMSNLLPLTPPAIVRHVDANLIALDQRVDQAEGNGIHARWEFGRELLRERIGKQLPEGRLDQLVELTGKSRTELQYRVRFAERFPDESEVHNAIAHFGSWFRIVNEALASTAHLSSAKDEWATPQELFDELDAEFGFTLDVCASRANAKCRNYFDRDALARDWTGVCWMNPPYSEIDTWVQKAYTSAAAGATVVCLVPSRTDVGWTWEWARRGEVRFIRGRVHFIDDEGNTGPAPFPSAALCFHETRVSCGGSVEMRSQDKLDVWVHRMPEYGGKWWMFVRHKNDEPEWVPSFEDWFRMIRALCFCELAKYEGRVEDPLQLPRDFFMRCFEPDLRALGHEEAWELVRKEFRFKR